MNLVTIAVFNAAFNAHLAQGRLQADGIEAYIQDEHSIQMNPFYNLALGGIKLQVKETDIEPAVYLLRISGIRTVFDTLPVIEKKQSHIIIRFLKYLAAAVILLGVLYFIEFGGKAA